MQQQEPLLRHSIQIAVETVDDQDAGLVALDGIAHERGELAWLELRRIDLPHQDLPLVGELLQRHPQRRGAIEETGQALLEDEHGRLLAALRRPDRVLRRERRLAGAGRTHDQRARTAVDAAAEHFVERRHAARHRILIDESAGARRR